MHASSRLMQRDADRSRAPAVRLRGSGAAVVSIAVAALLAMLTAAPAGVAAWEWPLASFRIDAGFGQLRNGNVTTAVWLSAQEPAVQAAHPGEVIFTRVEGAAGKGSPHGYGNFVVLEHEDGLRSVYANMGAVSSMDDSTASQGATLGTVGVSGFAYGDQLGFHLIDEELGQLVNPFLILPSLDDSQPPVIQGVFLQRGDDVIPVNRQTSIEAGTTFQVLVEAYDTVESTSGTRRVPPKTVTVTLGEQQPRTISFDTMQYGDNRFRLASGQPVDTLYLGQTRMRPGEVSIGTEPTSLIVRVEDFSGNRASAEYRLLPQAGPAAEEGTSGSS